MRKHILRLLAAAGVVGILALGSAFAQTSDKMSDDHMAGKKMSHQAMMDKMNGMSADDKAAMFDKMSEKDKMAATKMAGHDMAKMSSSERMEMMSKMSGQEKADAFDKMPMEKKMAVMKSNSMMHKKMMEKTEK